MLKSIAAIFSPKMEAKVVIQGFLSQEAIYMLQNTVKSWGHPGLFRQLSKTMIQIELEGKQAGMEAQIDQLSRNPMLGAGRSIHVTFAPCRGKHTSFRVAF